MDQVITNIQLLSNPVQGTEFGSDPQQTFIKAQQELEQFVDNNAHQWAQFFDQIDTENQTSSSNNNPSQSQLRFWILSHALRRIIEMHIWKHPAELQQSFFARFVQPLQIGFVNKFPLEHERAKYAELFSLLYIRTGTSTLKDSFQTLKAILDSKMQQSDQSELDCTLDFFLRSSLEVNQQMKKMTASKLDFFDSKINVLWGVYTRQATLDVINGVLQMCQADQTSQSATAEKLHNMSWKLISKLAKNRLIHREHLVAYWPEAVRQVSSLFGIAQSERLPTIISFLSTLTILKPEELPLSEKIAIVELVLQKVREQMSCGQSDDADNLESAYKAIGEFFHSVTQLFTHIMTASGKNNFASTMSHNGNNLMVSHHQRAELNYNYFSDEDDQEADLYGGGNSQLAQQLLTDEQIGKVKHFLCEIFELSKQLMMNESIKVAHQACSTILLFVEAMERGKLQFEHMYPNGVADVATILIDQIVAKLEAPADKVRLDVIDLDQDTDFEEQYLHMRDTIGHLLTILCHKQLVLLKSQLVKCLSFFDSQQSTTQVYQVYLTLLEIYQRKKLSQIRPQYEMHGSQQMALSQYITEESALLIPLFDPKLFTVDTQLARKSLTCLYYDLIDNECLSQPQAIFISQFSVSNQGLQHANSIVVAQAAKLLLRLYQKTLSKVMTQQHQLTVDKKDVLQTEQTLELLFNHVTAFLEKASSHSALVQRNSQNFVACASQLAQVLSYLLSCPCLVSIQKERRLLITNELLSKFMQAFQRCKIGGSSQSSQTYEASSQLFQVLKSFIVWCNPNSDEMPASDNQQTQPISLQQQSRQQQVEQLQQLLTELLEMVCSGSLDSRHSSDVLKLAKREIFGDFSFHLAERFIASGTLQQMMSDNGAGIQSEQMLMTNLCLTKALLQNFICQQKSFFGSMGPVAEKQHRNSILLVQSQYKTTLLPFLEQVLGVPPRKFATEIDLLKAETLLVVVKLMLQVAHVDPFLLFQAADQPNIADEQTFIANFKFILQILDQDYEVDDSFNLGKQSSEQVARETQNCAIKLLNLTLRRAFLAHDTEEPQHIEKFQKMQNLLQINSQNGMKNANFDQQTLDLVQNLVKNAAVKLVVKMHLTDQCIKEIGELQAIALKLFSVFDENQKNLYLDQIRFKLKNEEKMNYRNVLELKKLLEQRLSSQISSENFQDEYLAQVIEAREIKQLSLLDNEDGY